MYMRGFRFSVHNKGLFYVFGAKSSKTQPQSLPPPTTIKDLHSEPV